MTPLPKPPNLLWLAIVSWIMLIYMIATGNLHWYIWIFVAIVILERLLVVAFLYLEAMLVKAAAQQLIERMRQAQEAQTSNPFSGLGGPPLPPVE